MLFDNISSCVTSGFYKTNRNSGVNFHNGSISLQHYLAFSPGKKLTISFGPMDVHILKSRADTPIEYNNEWQLAWTNHGNGKIDGWKIGNFDKFYIGDFEGTVRKKSY